MPESPIVYHGTFAEFKKFDKGKMGSSTGSPSSYEGFFFATNKKAAISYASKLRKETSDLIFKKESVEKELKELTGDTLLDAIFKIYNKMYDKETDEKALKLIELIHEYDGRLQDIEEMGGYSDIELEESGILKKARLYLKNPLIHDMKGEDYRSISYVNLILKAKSEGYDGVIIKNTYDGGDPAGSLELTDIYVAFDESQIKIINNKGNNATETNLSIEQKYARIFGLPEEDIAHADYNIITNILTVTYGIDQPRYKQKKVTRRASKEFADFFNAPIFIGKGVDYILTAYLKAKGGVHTVRESQGISKLYYTSTDPVFGKITIKQFIETEVGERGNYTLAYVQNWMRKYNVSENDLTIWVSPKKWVANRYNLLAEEWDKAEKIPESEMNVYEIKGNEGFIIPESDDGDEGYLFVFKRNMNPVIREAVNQGTTTARFDSYLNTLSPMKAGMTKKVMAQLIRLSDGTIISRREWIEKKASDGGKIGTSKTRLRNKEEELERQIEIMKRDVPANENHPTYKRYMEMVSELKKGIFKEELHIEMPDGKMNTVSKTEADYFNFLQGLRGDFSLKKAQELIREGNQGTAPGQQEKINKIIEDVKKKPLSAPEKRDEIRRELTALAGSIDQSAITELRNFRPLGMMSEFGAAMGAEPRKGVKIDTPYGPYVFDEKRVPSKERVDRWYAQHKEAEGIRTLAAEYAFGLGASPMTVTGNFRVVERGRRFKEQGMLSPEEEQALNALEKYWQDHPELDRQKGYGVWGHNLEIMVPESLRKKMIEKKGSLIDALLRIEPGKNIRIDYNDVPKGVDMVSLPSFFLTPEYPTLRGIVVERRGDLLVAAIQSDREIFAFLYVQKDSQLIQIRPIPRQKTPTKEGEVNTIEYNMWVERIKKEAPEYLPEWEITTAGIRAGDTIIHKTAKYTAVVDKVYKNGNADITVLEAKGIPEWEKSIKEGFPIKTTVKGADIDRYFEKAAIKGTEAKKKEPWEMAYREFADYFRDVWGEQQFTFAEQVGKPMGILSQGGAPYHIIQGKKIGYSGTSYRDLWRLAIVDKALSEGKKVPEEVLADLAEKLKHEKEKLGGTGMAEQYEEKPPTPEVKDWMKRALGIEDYKGGRHDRTSMLALLIQNSELGNIRSINEAGQMARALGKDLGYGEPPAYGKSQERYYAEKIAAETGKEVHIIKSSDIIKPPVKPVVEYGAIAGGTPARQILTVTEPEGYYFGTQIEVLQGANPDLEPYFTGTIKRLLNNGELVEVHPEGDPREVSFRVPVDRVNVTKLVTQEGMEPTKIKKLSRYYYLHRPPSIGTQPEGFINHESWLPAKTTPHGRTAFGWVEYDRPLTPEETSRYELFEDEVELPKLVKELVQFAHDEGIDEAMKSIDATYGRAVWDWLKSQKRLRTGVGQKEQVRAELVRLAGITDVPAKTQVEPEKLHITEKASKPQSEQAKELYKQMRKTNSVRELDDWRNKVLFEAHLPDVEEDILLRDLAAKWRIYLETRGIPALNAFDKLPLDYTNEDYYFGTEVYVHPTTGIFEDQPFKGIIHEARNGGELWEVARAGSETEGTSRVPIGRLYVTKIVEKAEPRYQPPIKAVTSTERPAFNPEQAIKIAADSIEQLRRVDVFRVLDEYSNKSKELGDYIKSKRPDLAAEVDKILGVSQPQPKDKFAEIQDQMQKDKDKITGEHLRDIAVQMTSKEFINEALRLNRYREKYEKDPKLMNVFTSDGIQKWKELVEKHGEVGKLPDKVIEDYIQLFGEQALFSVFRGTKAKGIEGWRIQVQPPVKREYTLYYDEKMNLNIEDKVNPANYYFHIPSQIANEAIKLLSEVQKKNLISFKEVTITDPKRFEGITMENIIRGVQTPAIPTPTHIQLESTEALYKRYTSGYSAVSLLGIVRQESKDLAHSIGFELKLNTATYTPVVLLQYAEKFKELAQRDFDIDHEKHEKKRLKEQAEKEQERQAGGQAFWDEVKNLKVVDYEVQHDINPDKPTRTYYHVYDRTFAILENGKKVQVSYVINKGVEGQRAAKATKEFYMTFYGQYMGKPLSEWITYDQLMNSNRYEDYKAQQPKPRFTFIPEALPAAKPVQSIQEIKQQVMSSIQAARSVEELQPVLKGIGFLPLPEPEKRQVMDAYQNKYSILMSERPFGVPVKGEEKPKVIGALTPQQLFEAELRRKAAEARRISAAPTLTGGAVTSRKLEMFEPGAMEKAKAEVEARKRIEQLGLPYEVHPYIRKLAAGTQDVMKFGAKRGRESVDDLVLTRYVRYCPPGTIIDNRSMPRVPERWWVYPPKLRACMGDIEKKLAEAGAGMVRESQRHRYSIYQDGRLFANEDNPTESNNIYNMLVRTFPRSVVELRENFVHPRIHQRTLKQSPTLIGSSRKDRGIPVPKDDEKDWIKQGEQQFKGLDKQSVEKRIQESRRQKGEAVSREISVVREATQLTTSMRSYIRGAVAIRDVIHYYRDGRPPTRGVAYRARDGTYFVEAQDGQVYASMGWEDVSIACMPPAGRATA